MTDDLDLVFYYPSSRGAPSSVGRQIFENLINKSSKLPFSAISIFTPSEHEIDLKNKYEDINVYTEKSILAVPKSIVHIPISPHLFPNSKLLLHLYSKLKSYPLVFNYHGDIRKEVVLDYKYNHVIDYSYIPTYIFLPQLLNSASRLIVNSYLFKNIVSDRYGIEDVHVIPNGLEDYWYLPEHEPIDKKEGAFEIFFHGRLSAEKGVDILIKGFHMFLSKNKLDRAILYIAGEGPQKKYLESLISDLKIEKNVVFLGNVNKNVIKGYLKKVDSAIYPSIWDNFPLSFMEALAAANCPVYLSKKAGIYDFLLTSNSNLYTFDPTVENIVQVLADTYENGFDPKLIDMQAKFAYQYQWKHIINDYIDVYLSILE